MTSPVELKVGDRVRYRSLDRRSYGEDSWNGWNATVVDTDRTTIPWKFVKIKFDPSPYDENWQPVTWTERYNLRKLPDRRGK